LLFFQQENNWFIPYVVKLNRRALVEMENKLENLDGAALRTLYEKQLQELSDDLLNGAEWKDVQDKRKLLIAISKRLHGGSSNSPAEYPNRPE
jgi:hypothetical protein